MRMCLKKIIAGLISLVTFFLPVLVLAVDPPVTVPIFLGKIRGVLDAVIPFIIGLAVFVILWGIFTYITHAAEEEKRKEARAYIVWGIIGVFFMLSIWGFVNILVSTFALDKTIRSGDIPRVPPLCPPASQTTGRPAGC